MNSINKGMISYKSLSPNKNIEKSYAFDAIDYALEEDSILNIAVTAPYGAGKSSVIKSFFRSDNKYQDKTLFVSLACFNDSCFGEKSYKKVISDVDEVSLENNILQQLFFSETVHKLPWSNYYRIKNYRKGDLLQILLIVLLGFASFVKFGYFDKINHFFINLFNGFDKVLSDSFRNVLKSEWFDFILSCIFLIFFLIFLYYTISKIIEFVSKIRSIKWNSAAGEIEVKKKESSPLNDKIDEILYFFETTKYEYIVFEDLDRFESKNIFVKLRELNKLINLYKGINPRRIKFIYALNDDVFSSQNRVKFFDFIVPVIPKISRTNVGDYFLSQEKNPEIMMGFETELLNRLDKGVINDLGYYIDDLRLLNNIQNEFFIYCESYYSPELLNDFLKGKQTVEEKEITELFCLILYKNLYPEDFKKCHFGRGVLYNIFKLEKKIIEYCKNKIDQNLLGKDNYSLKKMAQLCPQYVKEYLNYKEKDIVDFLVAFIGRGLITKKYYTFISHVYPGELSNDDFTLVKKIKNALKIEFEDKIDNVELVLSKITDEIWDSSSILNKYILEYICKNNQDDYIRRFIRSLFAHDQIEGQSQYLKNYARDIFNEKTNPFIVEEMDWKKISLYFNNENLYAFWTLIEVAKGKYDEKISDKIRNFFLNAQEFFFCEENIRYTFEHLNLMHYYGMKIKDVSCINDDKLKSKIIHKNLYQLNKKNIQFLFPKYNGISISYNQVKKNYFLYQNIKENINEFIENLVLTKYCKLEAIDISNLILNPNITKKNISQLVSWRNLASIDLSKVKPRDYDNKSELLNKNGIKALIQYKKIEFNDETKLLLKLKYDLTLPESKDISPELDELKKMVKKETSKYKKAVLIEKYIIQYSLQDNCEIVEYAIRLFLHTKKIDTTLLIFVSNLIEKHFDYVEKILAESSGHRLSTQIFTSQYIDEDKKKRMLELIDFPGKIISLVERSPSTAKWLFNQYEKIIDDLSIVEIYKHVFDENTLIFDKKEINYVALRNTLKNLEWGKSQVDEQ